MAATKRSKTYLIDESTGSFKDSNNIPASSARDMIHSLYEPQGICQGRLTLESGVPISTTDQTAKTNVYFTPYFGNCIGIFDGTSWTLRTFSELTLALGTITSGMPYDVFIYDNSGTLTLELLAWTNGTTRATALALQDGIYCKTGALTRRYLGTFYTTATTTTEDSQAKRFLWNLYNQVPRTLLTTDSTDSWTYASTTYQEARGQTTNRVQIVTGLAVSRLELTHLHGSLSGTGLAAPCGIGEDSTTTNTGTVRFESDPAGAVGTVIHHTVLNRIAPLGFHFYSRLERAVGGTITFFGDAGLPGDYITGMTGSIQA
jgi:hypothetical protein